MKTSDLFNLYIFVFFINTGIDSRTTTEAREVHEGSAKEASRGEITKGGRIREKEAVNGVTKFLKTKKKNQK